MMSHAPFQGDNHYVPRLYLKRFEASTGKVWMYRTLVSHSQVPLWEERRVKGIAYLSHLYTRLVAGRETDEIEKRLSRDFETPAGEVLDKVIADARLTPEDWKHLVRFLAAQDVRTPVRQLQSIQRQLQCGPSLLEGAVEETVRHFGQQGKAEPNVASPKASNSSFPLRVTTESEPNQEFGMLKAEFLPGRSSWLRIMEHQLTHTLDVLHQHRWTIFMPPDGLSWFTSDNPVIKLNSYGNGKYDLKGGWMSHGTHIFLPLSPRHLLYTIVGGDRPPRRGTVMARVDAEMVRRCVAEQAYRMIFAQSPDPQVPEVRPRVVDGDLLQMENQQWSRWHEEQSTAERKLMGYS